MDVQGKPGIKSCDRHETGMGPYLAREIRTWKVWQKPKGSLVILQKEKLKADAPLHYSPYTES